MTVDYSEARASHLVSANLATQLLLNDPAKVGKARCTVYQT
jgi:hypothetical protein